MGALVTVHNDGPGRVEVIVGNRRKILEPGQDYRCSLSAPSLQLAGVPDLSDEEMRLHMGQGGARSEPREKLRFAED